VFVQEWFRKTPIIDATIVEKVTAAYGKDHLVIAQEIVERNM
jgi:hypothetical protein